jgi:nitrogen-specific signal transduction histidine kinase
VNGEFAGHIVILLDITEMKRGQERALANQKLESLGVLSAGIAHSFNNLLSTILAHSELALNEIPSETPTHENVATIAAVALRGSEIVNLLMAYAGQADPGMPELVELSSLIQETVRLLEVSLPRTTSLQLNISEDLPPIWANAGQVRQVVLNLIVNASEALEALAGTVAISAAKMRLFKGRAELGHPELRDGDYVLLEISDSGRGMTGDIKSKIFDPFFSTKFLGRGLGLASVRGIVRGAGGAIGVESSPGQGSTFKVWLPCSDHRQDGDGDRPQVRSKLAGTVLLVDDEDALNLAVASALRREGFSVIAARDGLAAVQLFASHSSEIDVVVLDLTLPGLSGRQVCEEIRRLKTDVRVLFTTAYDSAGPDELNRQSSERFLRKPYRLRELINTIREIMAPADAQ